jgi:hypothetical protein
MFQQAFFPIDKTPYAERFVNLQQAVKIDVFQNGSARLWLTTGEEITVTGPQAAPIIDLLDPSIAGLNAMKEEFSKPFQCEREIYSVPSTGD